MLKPLISEKSIAKTAEGKFTFILESKMKKVEIGKLVAKFFNVNPVSINTISRKGKVKRTGRVFGKRKDQNIAIVTLKKGQSIPGFDFPVEEKEEKSKKSDKPKALAPKKTEDKVATKAVNPVKKTNLTRTHKESK